MNRSITLMTRIERIKLLTRGISANILFYSGICWLYRFLLKRNKAVILTYHRVIDPVELEDSYIQAGMYVTRDVFSKHMKYLSGHYHVISLDELVDILANGKIFPRNTCVITFDDGWKDFYTYAFPILKQYNLPASVFLVSNYVSTNRWFWPEQVCYFLMKYFQAEPVPKYLPNQFPILERIGFFHLADSQGLTSVQKIDAIIERMKKLGRVKIEKAITEMQNVLNTPGKLEIQSPLLLNWNEINQMRKSQIAFGSHTRTHAILTTASEKQEFDEIIESKREIEEHLQTTCWAFCYPNGDYDNSIKKIVTEHYRCALTADFGFVKRGDDLFALKRIGIHNDVSFTKGMFACKISQILR